MSGVIIGLTGGIGCGKSTISDEFARLGITIVDADIIAREVVAPNSQGLKAIIERFGPEILTTEGSVNRAKLRKLIFADSTLTEWLNALLHPLIRTEIERQLASSQTQYTILSVPLLLENNLDVLCDRVLVVDINEATQIARVSSRDNSDIDTINAIIAAQIDRPSRLAKAHDIIDNSGNIADSLAQVRKLHVFYTELAKNVGNSKINLEK
ncbi:MAG: dephospho-CoA kinase [Glaciecola sp.]|jgi:dephospho-CoA kinase|nr:dephospho-CoA kinase [Glaciecola sp.]MDG1815768.1 dephospho-CoA kinase [Glaciecola sp.]MDG2099076.1 dephospho-CoA kinase [Glaciecola sp.]